MKIVLFFASLVFASISSASDRCVDLSGDFVYTEEDSAILLRLNQNECASVDFSIMLIKGNRLEPWFTVTYEAGPGLKPDPISNQGKYELLLLERKAIVKSAATTNEGGCTSSIEVSRDSIYNLTGTLEQKCVGQEPVKKPIKLIRTS